MCIYLRTNNESNKFVAKVSKLNATERLSCKIICLRLQFSWPDQTKMFHFNFPMNTITPDLNQIMHFHSHRTNKITSHRIACDMLQMISIILSLLANKTSATYNINIYIYMLHGSSIGCLSAFHRAHTKMNSKCVSPFPIRLHVCVNALLYE